MFERPARYGRYMVFTWSEYDNVEPFECMEDSFDTEDDAKDCAAAQGSVSEDGTKLYCVFDRVGGVFLKI